MNHDFWHQRWQQDQIGFHSQEINAHLQRFWPILAVTPGSRVFVPLCGKSNDMLWLLAQGHQVAGVELSPMAVDAFFSENNLHPNIRQQNNFLIYEIDGLQIFCGDFFALSSAGLGQIDAVYDRAALVAMPPEMRIEYVSHLSKLLEPGLKILLVSFDYPQLEMPGPPFSVPNEEIEMLFHNWCSIDLLTTEDALEHELRFKQRGLTSMNEQVYQLVVY